MDNIDSILHLTDETGILRVDVFRGVSGRYYINSQFFNFTTNSGQTYDSMSKALSDARVLFHLLNGVQELLSI